MSRLPTLTVSIVSHGQAALAEHVMRDLERCTTVPLEVVLTVNMPEPLPFDPNGFSYPVTVLENRTPKGFGANHNAAFRVARGEYFCVLNPDIRLSRDPYPGLVAHLADVGVGVVGPAVTNPAGQMEDSARRFPTLWTLVRKVFVKGTHLDYVLDRLPVEPDWLAGMFMLFRAATFREASGFDERYFLYYEDVDLCMRLRTAGYRVVWEPGVPVVHDARRTSRRNLRYFSWHMLSFLRYLLVSRRRARAVA
jgi:N-acetylglucosaminyl-diphospho-decaprenol L-rhamnosyltransferase